MKRASSSLLTAACVAFGSAAISSPATSQPASPASGQPAASKGDPALDYEFFKSKVEPVFLAKREGHTRCVVCHTVNNAPLHLVPLSPGAASWNDEQSRQNFVLIQKVVVPGWEGSKLVTHPLAEEAGGDPHHGGGQQFTSQDDPDWQTLKAFVLGAKLK
ncbi:MAG: hypothetical protein JO228_00375 [Xanthobacteraceae bacterium]|nr:hypothetical protein [Xanthobacteraceae bacterium]